MLGKSQRFRVTTAPEVPIEKLEARAIQLTKYKPYI